MENKQTGRRRLPAGKDTRGGNAAVYHSNRFNRRFGNRLRSLRQRGRIRLPRLAGIGRLVQAVGMAGFVLTRVPVLATHARGILQIDREAGQTTASR